MSSRSPDEFRLGASPYDRGPGRAEEPEDPYELLRRARRLTADGHPSAGGAWERTAPPLRRAGGSLTPGDHAAALDATALLRTALGTTASRGCRADRARLCLALARTHAGAPGRPAGDEEVSLLGEAVRHADSVAGDGRLSVLARLALGIARAERGHRRQASAVLREALSGLAEADAEAAQVRAGVWLAFCAQGLGEPGRAAREFARAAGRARPGDGKGPGGTRAWLRGLPEPYGPPGRYQMDVYGEVCGTGAGPLGPRRSGVHEDQGHTVTTEIRGP
ncbi:hypothetical protein EDD98_6830 [Streptomyces sp. PanSC19]|uniref:hypothetical protein n=1 Tax=Streptomyces sp. PanSC19 TaxID=1520455 RepID=UPI000F463373|nr:hypothetical protein [Streptomyces sp. PanSC19]ROQ27173.1 hypothetical protein EDD98_6830 [Streptomyces sp. PanSC19]